MKTVAKLWTFLILLIMLCPLGIILPEHFKAGAAWGEWGAGEIKTLVGYVPQGLKRLSCLWTAPIPDYAFKGWGEKGICNLSFSYVASALIGVAITVLVVFVIGKMLVKKEDKS